MSIDLQALMNRLDEVHGLRNSECGPGGETNYGKGPMILEECEFGGLQSLLLFATDDDAIEYAEIDFNTKRTEQYLRFGPIIYRTGSTGSHASLAEERGVTVSQFTGLEAVGHGSDYFTELAASINAAG